MPVTDKEIKGRAVQNRKARKTHICSCCGREIKPKTVYEHTSLEHPDRTFTEWKAHLLCRRIMDSLQDRFSEVREHEMTEEEFRKMCYRFSEKILCGHCKLKETEKCEKKQPCTDFIIKFLDYAEERRTNK